MNLESPPAPPPQSPLQGLTLPQSPIVVQPSAVPQPPSFMPALPVSQSAGQNGLPESPRLVYLPPSLPASPSSYFSASSFPRSVTGSVASFVNPVSGPPTAGGQNSTGPLGLGNIPADLFMEITDLVDDRSLYNLSLVTRRFYSFAASFVRSRTLDDSLMPPGPLRGLYDFGRGMRPEPVVFS
ncbi:hypothetical protein N7462_009157 [Penicillium macrosclerotiorum]|uniref:uncharacterized protein n=1 Tax=Penicillium macrosclerotiorum TaxID=303699 RepID=UPI00254710CD|nr:uncharacterized protein N7462_009157 [Penicillium macrosclerotiorum]KAJ5676260.1 hypothetical protein N7462_009157 [Penicillium macrosclerotiorum]